jgi:hypothetical protein
VPTFSNARYLFARQEWEHWERAELRARHTTDPYYEDRLLPIMRAAGRGWWPTIQRMDRALTRTHPTPRVRQCAINAAHRPRARNAKQIILLVEAEDRSLAAPARTLRAAVCYGERRHPLSTLRLDCVDARPREWPRAAGCGEALRGLEVEHGGA